MPPSPVDQIKERLSIADVVGSYVKLERAGANFKARCPFHSEKTPSFFVSPARGTYHCFGCSRGGDMFSFVEEIEGLEFRDALKILASKAGVELKAVNQKERSEHDRIYSVLEAAASHFEENLRENNEALIYLKGRGLSEETMKKWRLGFAKDGWSALYEALKKKGFSDADMDKAGLTIMGNRGPYDRFRARIMFPLSGQSGRIIGFSGRIFLPYDKEKEKESAKYVNSPDTVLYNKSRVLYGYDKAKSAMMRENTCVLVEGQMDLLMSHQSGIENAVALSGTALTEDHLKMIKRFSDRLILSLDSDEAGFTASERAWRLAVSLGLDVRVAKIPRGMDPADFADKDPEGFKKTLSESKHIIEFLLSGIKDKGGDKRAFSLEVGKRVLPYVAEIGNKIDQAHFVSLIGNEIGVKEEHLWEEIGKIRRNPDLAPKPAFEENTAKSFSRRNFIYEKILGMILWQEGLDKNGKETAINAKEARTEFERINKEYGLSGPPPDKSEGELVFESELYYSGHAHLKKELEELLSNLELEALEERFNEAMRELTLTEKSGELDKSEELLKKCQEISKKMNEIKGKKF